LIPTPAEASPRPGPFLQGAAIAQLLIAPYLLLAGTMAAEMSGLLSAVLMAAGVLVAVAAVFLFRRRRWAWRLSAALAALSLVAGICASFLHPIGAIHAVGAAAVLGALWAGRPAIPGLTAQGSTRSP
jgi:hypothetical protein